MKRYNPIFQMRGAASLDFELKPFYSSFSTGFLAQKHNIHQWICNISSLGFLSVMQLVESESWDNFQLNKKKIIKIHKGSQKLWCVENCFLLNLYAGLWLVNSRRTANQNPRTIMAPKAIAVLRHFFRISSTKIGISQQRKMILLWFFLRLKIRIVGFLTI